MASKPVTRRVKDIGFWFDHGNALWWGIELLVAEEMNMVGKTSQGSHWAWFYYF